MPRRRADFDFNIHVDPSCLSAPSDDIMDSHPHEQPDEMNRSNDTPIEESTPKLQADETSTMPASLDEEDYASEDRIAETSIISDSPEGDIDNAETAHEETQDRPGPDDEAISDLDDASEMLPSDISFTDGEQSQLESESADQSVLPSIESELEDEHENSLLSEEDHSRRTSGRTERLIQAAARDIIAEIEKQREDSHGNKTPEHDAESALSEQADVDRDHFDQKDSSMIGASDWEHEEDSQTTPIADDGGDSSSHHDGTDEDVFSDGSHRSSLGSYDGGSESGKATEIPDNISVSTRDRTPRISDISQYDRQDPFIPTTRGNPRPPFRTPSDVRAIQMSSPAPSVFGSVIGSPRSSKRPFPTVSRLGSPAPSAQYSPKNRTPSRFKVKQEAPLVLLHATLLPLRWSWGEVINSFDSSEMSEEAKTLRKSWRMLQDRMGETLGERGILLGHPQDDYEVLEERLLEALDLPMRRRARVLECGHYLGPANEATMTEDPETEEDDYDMASTGTKRHWCNTCKGDVRYESLGPGKIFRVKVYASNGLMRAGAWAACWKEMERVDTEIEPIVDASVQEELARLSAALHEREEAEQRQVDLVQEIIHQVDEQQNASMHEAPGLVRTEVEIGPIEYGRARTSAVEERRLRDEERLREIYGMTPELEQDRTQSRASDRQPHPDSYVPPPSPRSPSEEAYERRQSRRSPPQSDSLPELLLRTARVLLQDTKNVVIVTLGVFVLLMALRTAPQQQQPAQYSPNVYEAGKAPQVHSIAAFTPIVESVASLEATSQQPAMVQASPAPSSVSTAIDPCATQNAQQHQAMAVPQDDLTQQTVVKVVETVTETETMKVQTITETETLKVQVTATVADLPDASSADTQESNIPLVVAEMHEAEMHEDSVSDEL